MPPDNPVVPSGKGPQGGGVLAGTVAFRQEMQLHSGPLPDPQTLAGYESACAGAADRIIKMAELQAAHRQGIEKSVVDGNIANERRGQICACVTVVLFGAGGVYLVATGKSTQGLAAIITPLITLAAVFFYGVRKRDKELEEKRGPPQSRWMFPPQAK